MPEKRGNKRYRKRLPLKFGSEGNARLAFTEDISSQGLFIKTTNIVSPGSKIMIQLTMPDNQIVTLEALVMWGKRVPPQMIHRVNKSGMGVRILRFLSGGEQYSRMCEELSVR